MATSAGAGELEEVGAKWPSKETRHLTLQNTKSNKKNVPNALSYTDPYQVRRGRGRPGPLFGAGQKVIAGVFVYDMWYPKWGKRKSERTHKI